MSEPEEGDTPIYTGPDGRRRMVCNPGSELTIGSAFDDENGYFVLLAFKGATVGNSMDAKSALSLATKLRESHPDDCLIPEALERMAAWCLFMDAAWQSQGKPSGGVDHLGSA